MNFAYEVPLSYSLGCISCRETLRHGADGLNSHPKESVLLIFIVLKNSSSARELWVQW
jgi:hypothetical protein